MGDRGGDLIGISETDHEAIQDRTESAAAWIGLYGDSGAGGNRLSRPHPRTIPMAPVGMARRTPPRPRSGSGVERVGLNLINDVVARRLREHDLACQVDA